MKTFDNKYRISEDDVNYFSNIANCCGAYRCSDIKSVGNRGIAVEEGIHGQEEDSEEYLIKHLQTSNGPLTIGIIKA